MVAAAVEKRITGVMVNVTSLYFISVYKGEENERKKEMKGMGEGRVREVLLLPLLPPPPLPCLRNK